MPKRSVTTDNVLNARRTSINRPGLKEDIYNLKND